MLRSVAVVVCLVSLWSVVHCREPKQNAKLTVNGKVEIQLTSGERSENGRQIIPVDLKAGRYQLKFRNSGSRYENRWMIWDYITLRQIKGKPVWEIGNDDVGKPKPDYSEKAFSEFSPKTAKGVTKNFKVGATKAKNFCRELNDYDCETATVEFRIDKEQASKPLELLVSTLYSTHKGASGFAMNITVERLNNDIGKQR